MTWIVLITAALKLADGTLVTDYIATEDYVTGPGDSPANRYFAGVIRGNVERAEDVTAATMGSRTATATFGRIEVLDLTGERIAWRTASIKGQIWRVELLQRGRPFSARIAWFTARGLSIVPVSGASYGVTLTDRSSMLDPPLQDQEYGSGISNVSLRGRPKPLLLGAAFQVPAFQPETTGNVRCDVTDGAHGGVSAVYDNGVARVLGTQWAPSPTGFELLTARGGKLAANAVGNLLIGATDALGGAGAFASLTGWTVDTTSGTVARPWDSADKGAGIALSNSDYRAAYTSGVQQSVRAKRTLRSGKWYCELVVGINAGPAMGVSNADSPLPVLIGYDTTSWGYFPSGDWVHAGAVLATYAGYDASTVLQLAIDLDNNLLWIGADNTWLNGDPAATSGGTPIAGPLRVCASLLAGDHCDLFPAVATQTYSAPSGFSAMQDTSSAGSVTLVSGGVQLVSNGGNAAALTHGTLTPGTTYHAQFELDDVVAGGVQLLDGATVLGTWTQPGTCAVGFTAAGTTLTLRRLPGDPVNVWVDDLVCKTATGGSARLPDVLAVIADRISLTDLDTTAINALDSAAPYRVGLPVSAGQTTRAVLTELLDAWNGWCLFNAADELTVGRLSAPTGTPVMTITEVQLAGPITSTPDDGRGLSNVLLAGRNWEPFTDSEVPTGMSSADRALVTAPYRYRLTAGSSNSSDYATERPSALVKERVSRTPIDGMPTVLCDAADGQDEVDRRWSMYDRNRATHTVPVLTYPGDVPALLALALGAEVRAVNATQPAYAAGVDLILTGRTAAFPVGHFTLRGWG